MGRTHIQDPERHHEDDRRPPAQPDVGDLLEVALDDASTISSMPGYRMNGRVYHRTYGARESHVCLAGAVMARRLGAEPHRDLNPTHFPEELKLYALNSMRVGNWTEAARHLAVALPEEQQEALKAEYRGRLGHRKGGASVIQESYLEFERTMRSCLAKLRTLGL